MIMNQIKKMDKKEFLHFEDEYIKHLKEYHIHYLNGEEIQSEQDYFNYFKKVYLFGNHFGNNWNAFMDCMHDLITWDEVQGFILVIYNYQYFLQE